MKNDSQFNISITAGTIIKAILIGVGAFLLYYLRDIALNILSAVVLAAALEPGTDWLTKKGVPRVLAVVLIYLLVLFVLFGVVYFLLPPLLGDIINFTSNLPGYLESLQDFTFLSFNLSDSVSQAFPSAATIPNVSNMVTSLGGGFLTVTGFFFGGIFGFVSIIILSFYILVQEDGVENLIRLVAPDNYESYLIDLWHRSQKKIGRWLQGQLLLGLIMGVFVFLGLSIMRIRFALLLAMLAAIFEIIPIVGPIMAAVPAIAIAFGESVSLGTLVLGFYIIIQQFENHLIYPLVFRKIVGVPVLLVIISLIVGGRLAGFLGILLAVPLATILMELVGDIEKKKKLTSEKA